MGIEANVGGLSLGTCSFVSANNHGLFVPGLGRLFVFASKSPQLQLVMRAPGSICKVRFEKKRFCNAVLVCKELCPSTGFCRLSGSLVRLAILRKFSCHLPELRSLVIIATWCFIGVVSWKFRD